MLDRNMVQIANPLVTSGGFFRQGDHEGFFRWCDCRYIPRFLLPLQSRLPGRTSGRKWVRNGLGGKNRSRRIGAQNSKTKFGYLDSRQGGSWNHTQPCGPTGGRKWVRKSLGGKNRSRRIGAKNSKPNFGNLDSCQGGSWNHTQPCGPIGGRKWVGKSMVKKIIAGELGRKILNQIW